ncbi:MAG: hypothetical protein ABH849_02480 [Nanoarchaeota archaeon]
MEKERIIIGLRKIDYVTIFLTILMVMAAIWTSFENRRMVEATLNVANETTKLVEATLIVANETSKMANATQVMAEHQINPDVYFSILTRYAHLRNDGIIYFNEGYFWGQSKDFTISILNKGERSIKILDVRVSGSCFDRAYYYYSSASDEVKNEVIEPGKDYNFEYELKKNKLIEDIDESCDLLFKLITDEITLEQQVIIEEEKGE